VRKDKRFRAIVKQDDVKCAFVTFKFISVTYIVKPVIIKMDIIIKFETLSNVHK